MFLKRREEKKAKGGSCFGSPKEEGEAETLIKDKRLFLSLSFLLCASATFTALLFFPLLPFFLIYCSGKHIPPLCSVPAAWESAVQPPLRAHTHADNTEMHTTHTLTFVTCAFLGTNKHAHA